MSFHEGTEDDYLQLRRAIQEAIEPFVADVKDSIGEALRSVFRDEMPQALSPVLARLDRSSSKSKRSSAAIAVDDMGQADVQRSSSNRSMERSLDASKEFKVDSKNFRRLSAPMQIARAATSAHRAAQRLKRTNHFSPENSEDVVVEELPVPVRRNVPTLSLGASKPLQQLLREESPVPGRIPTFLRGLAADSEAERVETLELMDAQQQQSSGLGQSSGRPEAERPTAPAGDEPRLPGMTQGAGASIEAPPSPVDFGDLQRQTSSSTEESNQPPVEERRQKRGSLREMNSLEIVPSFTASESKPAAPPWSARVAGFFARMMPKRATQSRLGRLATRESFQGRVPSKQVTQRPDRSVRPRSRGGTPGAPRSISFFEVKKFRRSAVILQPAALEDLRRKTAPGFWKFIKWPFSDPMGRPRQCWDLVACILLAIQLLYLPFQSAFITNQDLEDSAVHAFASLLITIDIFWAVDLVLNFTTGYRDSVQVLHNDASSKVTHYLKSWFLVDFLATFPSLLMHILLLIYGSSIARQLFWMTLSPLIRSPRLYAQLSMLRRMEAHLKSSWLSSVAALVELFMLPVVFSHLSACALWALGRSNLEADPTVSSWIKMGIDLSNDAGALQAVPIGERYMTALYFAVTVMSTVGLGDINMDLVNERALLCLIMATTSLVVGVAVNGVAAIVAKLNERTAVTNEQLAKVSRFLKAYNVPGDLQRRVHSYLLQFFENQEREDTKSSLMVWLKKSESLRVNMNLALTGTCLARHHLIRLVPRDVLVNVCDICDMEFHPPGEELQQAGSEVKSCFYIRRGEVQTCEAEAKDNPRAGNVLAREPDREGTSEFTTIFHTDGADEGIDEVQMEIEAADRKRPGRQFRGGSFIGDFRLFLGTSRSWKTATCISFCELISIDVEKFRSLMIEQAPEIFDMLVIYSSIDNDCPKVLLRCLEEQFLCPEDALLFGEGALHHCAKKNAHHCADHLLDELSADVAVLDAQGKTPSQIASKLNHKEVFWSIIRHGGVATDEEVLPVEAYAMRAKNQRRVKASASLNSLAFEEIDQDYEPKSSMEVRDILQVNSYSCAEWDQEGRKSVDDLVEELNTCRSELVVGAGKHVLRRVQLVRLRLLAIVDDHARALVELQTDPWMRAPEPKLAKLPSRRVLRSQSIEDAFEALLLEIGVPPELLEEKLLVTLATASYTESKPSMAFPGLDTEYIVHEQTMKVRSQAVQRAEAIGLPQGLAFEKEVAVSPLNCVTRQFFWPVLVKMRFGKHADVAKTEELKRKASERRLSDGDSSRTFGRFNPLRFSMKKKNTNNNIIDVGAR